MEGNIDTKDTGYREAIKKNNINKELITYDPDILIIRLETVLIRY